TAARPQVPAATAGFARQPLSVVVPRVRALANIRAASYRFEANGVGIQAGGNLVNGVVEGVRGGGPRGYALTAGHEGTADNEGLVERGLARSWHLRLGEEVGLDGSRASTTGRVHGIARPTRRR